MTVGVPGIVLAGSVAKSALVAEVQGADVTAFGGRDLEHDLRTIMTASGPQAGRFADQGNTPRLEQRVQPGRSASSPWPAPAAVSRPTR